MVSESDTGRCASEKTEPQKGVNTRRCASKDAGPRRVVDLGGSHIKERVPVKTLGSEGGWIVRHEAVC